MQELNEYPFYFIFLFISNPEEKRALEYNWVLWIVYKPKFTYILIPVVNFD